MKRPIGLAALPSAHDPLNHTALLRRQKSQAARQRRPTIGQFMESLDGLVATLWDHEPECSGGS